MGQLFAYSVVCSLALLLGWGAYVMSRGGSPRLRRGVILSVYTFSLVILPLIVRLDLGARRGEISVPVDSMADSGFEVIAESGGADPIMDILLLVYLLGVAVCGFLTLFGLLRVVRIMKGSNRRKIDGFTFLIHNRPESGPFCFGRFIVISSADVDRGEIVMHEKAHVSLYHFVDLCVAQFAAVLCWYCPAAWLLRRDLKLVHEYEADAAVVEGGVEVRPYCRMLVMRAAGVKAISEPGSHFALYSLKKRILMMQTPKSGFGSGRRVIMAVLGAMVCCVLLLSGSVAGSAVGRISQTSLSVRKDLTTDGAFVIYGVDFKRHKVKDREGVVLPHTGAIICRDRSVLDRVASEGYKISVDGKIVSKETFSALPASRLWKVAISGKSMYVYTTDYTEASIFNSVESALESESKRSH